MFDLSTKIQSNQKKFHRWEAVRPIDKLTKLTMDEIGHHQEFDERPTAYPVCSLHFRPDDIIENGRRKTLKKGVISTIFPK